MSLPAPQLALPSGSRALKSRRSSNKGAIQHPQHCVVRESISHNRRSASVVATVTALALVCAAFLPRSGSAFEKNGASATARATPARAGFFLGDSLLGKSRKLRVRFVSRTKAFSLPILAQLFGDSASSQPGLYATHTDSTAEPFHFITMHSFAEKIAGRIGAYNIGFFPSERHAPRSVAYNNPDGFIEVSALNQFTQISEHFKLGDFLTHDQVQVWPKYLVLKEPLLDKLELVIAELGRMGVPVRQLRVMSGFRTPQYNEPGVGAGGRAQDSRHQFGDAADVYIVNGPRDWMSDINHDGRVDTRDAKLLASAAERVELAHPELVGGIGIYRATKAHGPFVHIDVRGVRARWSIL